MKPTLIFGPGKSLMLSVTIGWTDEQILEYVQRETPASMGKEWIIREKKKSSYPNTHSPLIIYAVMEEVNK